MMFALKRLLLVFGLVLLGYCFWPREPSLSRFEPKRMAELQVGLWKDASSMKKLELLPPLYELYERQYHMPPISSMKMALDTARALQLFHGAPDAADQEKAILPLQLVFMALKKGVGASFDPGVVTQLELTTWRLRTDKARRGELTAAWSEKLGMLYGCPAAKTLPAAKSFAIAAKLAGESKWSEAEKNAVAAWTGVQELSPPPSKSK